MLSLCYSYVNHIKLQCLHVCGISICCRTAFVILSVALVAYNIQNYENNYLEQNTTEKVNGTIQWPLEGFLQVANYLNDSEWQDALDEGKMWFIEDEAAKKDLPSLDIDSPSYRHQKTFSSSPKTITLSSAGYINEFSSRYARQKYEKLKGLICNEVAETACELPINCNELNKYRSYDGSCNNLRFPFGVGFKPFRRILPPDYADGTR